MDEIEDETGQKRVILAVSHKYNNAGDTNHRRGTKKVWKVYYVLTPSGRFGTFTTNPIAAAIYKTKIRKRRLMFCRKCGRAQYHFIKNDKELEKRACYFEDCPSNEKEDDDE